MWSDDPPSGYRLQGHPDRIGRRYERSVLLTHRREPAPGRDQAAVSGIQPL
jgi:hypothetical protein